ncbi:MAG: YkvA family protein [Chloroflexota bacterium]
MRPPNSLSALRLSGGLRGLWFNVRLAWRLFQDGRVPLRLKTIIPAAIVYMFWPVDFIMDIFPLLGQVDDLTAMILAVVFFVRAAPPPVVAEHVAALQGRRAAHPDWPPDEPGETIEGQYRVLDD